MTVSWQNVAGVNYFLERSSNLASPFTLVITNIVGQAETAGYGDTSATVAWPFFHRVGVKPHEEESDARVSAGERQAL